MKTIEQTRDEIAVKILSENRGFKLDETSLMDSQYSREINLIKAGFDASTAIHQERTKGLVEALSIAADRLLSVSLAIKEHDTNINPQFFIERFEKFSKDARKAL